MYPPRAILAGLTSATTTTTTTTTTTLIGEHEWRGAVVGCGESISIELWFSSWDVLLLVLIIENCYFK
jgi:hypothetical protein